MRERGRERARDEVKPVSLRTQRVCLRQWREEDKPAFAELNADPLAMAHFPAPLSREESDALVDRCAAEIARQGWGFWAAEDMASGALMGMVGLHPLHESLPFAPGVEVGWRLARLWWGRGMATEAAGAALDWGFDALGLSEVVSFTARSNVRSQSVMQRLGMQAAGAFAHPMLPAESSLNEHVLYRLPVHAWRARSAVETPRVILGP